MSKLLEHFKRMQEMATSYLTLDGYVDREDRVYHNDDQAARAFASDMIYMLDGPEQREAQKDAEAIIYLDARAIESFDKMIDVALIFGGDEYDDLWNLRNCIQPFVPGDKHYDDEDDETAAG
jgi:hypothetical protein